MANGGSAVCHAWGAKVSSEDIVPKFGRRSGADPRKFALAISGMRGASIKFVPNDPAKPTLTGPEALAKLDDLPYKTGRATLDGERPKMPRNRMTLAGD